MRRILGLVSVLLGGACSNDPPRMTLPAAPTCQVPTGGRVIQDGFDCFSGWIAVDDARVYWQEMSLVDGSESAFAGDKCGGAKRRLGTTPLASLAPADGMLYGVDQNSFFAVPVDGRARVAVVTGFSFLSAMAIDPADDTAVVASSFTCGDESGCPHPGSLWRIHRSGGTAEPLLPASRNALLSAVAVVPDGYYVLGSMGDELPGVYLVGRDGAIREHIFDGYQIDLLVADPVTGELFARSSLGLQVLDGHFFRTVWPTVPGDIQSFVLDERYIYAAFADGHLGRRPRHGGDETVLLQGRVVAVGLDASAVYAFDCTLSSGRILQLPR